MKHITPLSSHLISNKQLEEIYLDKNYYKKLKGINKS